MLEINFSWIVTLNPTNLQNIRSNICYLNRIFQNKIVTQTSNNETFKSVLLTFYWRTGIPELWTQVLDSGLWTLYSGRLTLDAVLWTLDSGRWTLGATLKKLGTGHWTLSLTGSE